MFNSNKKALSIADYIVESVFLFTFILDFIDAGFFYFVKNKWKINYVLRKN